MRVLLDTHILLWALTNDNRLPDRARELIEDMKNDIFYSIVCPWEVEIKRLAHSDVMKLTAKELVDYCEQAGYQSLPVKEAHIFALHQLSRKESAPNHKDPFDRIMVCQAKTENMTFITHDSLISDYDESCVLAV